MINLINFILTKYMGVLKKIYLLLITHYSFNTFIFANEDETEYIEDYNDDSYDYNDYNDDYDDNSYVDNDYDDDENYDYYDNNDENLESNYNDDYDDNDIEEGTYNNENQYKENRKNISKKNKDNLYEEIIDAKIEDMKNRIEKKEQDSKKKFFESYNRLKRDVDILKARDPYKGKKDGKANLDSIYQKFRLINLGIYGYCNISKFIKYALGNRHEKIPRIEKTIVPADKQNNIYRGYLLNIGGCLNINVSSGGLSIVGGYFVAEDTLIFNTVDTYVGFNCDILFRFPAINAVDIVFNVLDPLGIILYFTGLRRRTEWYVGVKMCWYESRDIGDFKPGTKNNTFKFLKELKDDSSKPKFNKFAEILFQHCTMGRRVYINQHIFYSFSSSLIFPVLLIFLSKDCGQVKKFFSDCKFLDTVISFSIGLLI